MGGWLALALWVCMIWMTVFGVYRFFFLACRRLESEARGREGR